MIERLLAGQAQDVSRIGGKACGLLRLLDAGLDVPEAWVIPASVSMNAEQRHEMLGATLADWWGNVTRQFPTCRWAVRSSAVAEDLDDASFAGVYETKLGLASLAGIRSAVSECWAAIADERARVYRIARGLEDPGIALVLQRLIEPRVSGVLLTENPLAPFAGQLVIDAAWGLGEAVVSGATDPDHVVIERSTGIMVSERIGAKQVEHVYDEGITVRDVPHERRTVRCLDDGDLLALRTLADRVVDSIGERRDLEWTIEDDHLYVLQDRPITGLPSADPKEVWTRRFGDEYLADYQAQLCYDLTRHWLTIPMFEERCVLDGRPELRGRPTMQLFDGHVYFSGTYIRDMMRGVPRVQRAGSTIEQWLPAAWMATIMAEPFSPWLFLNSMRSPARDKGRGRLRDNLPALDAHCRRVSGRIRTWAGQDLTRLSDAEWREQYREVEAFGLDHFRIIRWTMGQYNMLFHDVLAKLLTRWADDATGEAYQAMISGLPGTRTAEINRDVYELGLLARADPDLVAQLRGDGQYADVRAVTQDSRFWVAFDGFVRRHGHRSSTRTIDAARWHEQPDLVLGLMRAQVRAAEAPGDPSAIEQRCESQRRRAEAAALAAAGPVKRRILRWVIGRTQQFTVARENQRYYLDYLLNHLRQLVLEQGRRAAARGALEAVEDVFLLPSQEFWLLVDRHECHDDVARIREVVAAAKRHREHHASRLPATYRFDDVPTEAGEQPPAAELVDGAISGLAAAAGRGSGPVRVVRSLADLADVRPGDILVAANIDPGWTSVFPMISGLVTETGGILSHGAILAREYGVPTVTCVPDAVTRFEPGVIVAVDGTAGRVIMAASPD
ncbi:PEP/pyruvate-binding domain-containing protein [Mycobacterium shigaense]|uniref:Putative phosphotransferase YvkC n=1 Tax=Mycobacterium shigaense TaxID=722731 RepID=A0A1Z4ELP2_9MYCO|nr:PEP/pyruvate-binding domain-containing protein [Mycobacterium shigaense]MEA1121030.1 PEP/pyruvate-binding domain-containing protein [Mycobacterium shigaense]PRI14608.1 hypothetical protein B2J96_14865 [Mycobacterium shigaense]BAX93868.1 putative phosphotransferase YvkC [Mycobacterium shigaense]